MVNNCEELEKFSIDKREVGDVPDLKIQEEDFDVIMKELTSKVSSISVQDREAGLFDLHGISGVDD